jgi:DNA-binding GntR family transcriptional regulator
VTLNRFSPKPLYRQLCDVLIPKLGTEYAWGDRLPSEAELAAEYDVNRLTVRQAIADLARQGLVDPIQGKGTFVVPPAIRYRIAAGRDASFTAAMADLGHETELRVLRTTRDDDPAIRQELQTRRVVTRYDFLRLVDGAPWSLSRTWIAASRFPGLTRHWSGSSSLYAVLREQYGIRIMRSGRTFSAEPADPVDAEHLMLGVGAPVLVTRGLVVSEHHEPIALTEHRCRGDRVQFTVEFE